MAITAVQKKKYWDLRTNGYSMEKAAKAAGFSRATAARLEKSTTGGLAKKELMQAKGEDDLAGPIKYDDLIPEAKRALEDFGYFQRRYFGRIAYPWQVEAANKIAHLLETPNEEYAVINVAPGLGKTTCFVHDIPAWITARDRNVRGMIGSATMSLAKRNVMRLRRSLERIVPEKADPNLLRKGLALDAESTLALDFGRFKPLDREMWTSDGFVVMQHEEMGATSEKEPTWSAYGMDTSFIGGRYNFVIWDDLVDPRKLRSSEQREALQDMWVDVGETRLEPGGLLILQGQRISSDDLYRYALDMTAPYEEEDEREEELEGENRNGKKYHHIVFKAHYEEKCSGEHPKGQAAWPDGCLLSPQRLPWNKIQTLMENRGERFQVIYQQQDLDPAEVLVPKSWVYGDSDFPGCLDKDRDRLEIPRGINVSECLSIATADPSPTNYWSVQWWLYHEPSEQRFLMDMVRQKMDAPDFLDYHPDSRSFVGVMEDMQSISESLGFPISTWVVEQNAAQRFLLQYDHVRRWRALHGVDIIAHSTNRNKSDKDYGIETLAPHYRYGRVRLPWRNEGKIISMKLVDELTHYPYGRTDDCVMANWFLEWNLPNLYTPSHQRRSTAWRPTWLKARA